MFEECELDSSERFDSGITVSVCCVVSAVCVRGHGHADSGPLLLRDESHGDGDGVGERLAAGLRLPADGADHQRPGRMGKST